MEFSRMQFSIFAPMKELMEHINIIEVGKNLICRLFFWCNILFMFSLFFFVRSPDVHILAYKKKGTNRFASVAITFLSLCYLVIYMTFGAIHLQFYVKTYWESIILMFFAFTVTLFAQPPYYKNKKNTYLIIFMPLVWGVLMFLDLFEII
ncbi:hypothetical protein M2135_001012 [Parabacteroides sp. PF5-9]|nr:hypothetical protein [Parabacteroides sp. PF5-9]